MTGRLSSSDHTSSRRPNGAATSKPKTSRPIGDHNRIGTENNAATKNRRTHGHDHVVHRHRAVPAMIQAPAGSGCAVSGGAIGSHTCAGTDCPSHS